LLTAKSQDKVNFTGNKYGIGSSRLSQNVLKLRSLRVVYTIESLTTRLEIKV